MAKVGNLKLDFMAKSIGIHFFEFEDMFSCYRDNENLKKHFGHMDTLNFYYKDTLEKVTMQRTQQFSGFVCYRKNPIKCKACTVALKIENDYFSRNVPISNDPIVRISIHLAKK